MAEVIVALEPPARTPREAMGGGLALGRYAVTDWGPAPGDLEAAMSESARHIREAEAKRAEAFEHLAGLIEAEDLRARNASWRRVSRIEPPPMRTRIGPRFWRPSGPGRTARRSESCGASGRPASRRSNRLADSWDAPAPDPPQGSERACGAALPDQLGKSGGRWSGRDAVKRVAYPPVGQVPCCVHVPCTRTRPFLQLV